MKYAHMVAFVLVIVGALNWGLHALGFNVVEMIFGTWPMIVKIIYLLVGLSAVYLAATHKSDCKMCTTDAPKM